MIFGVMGALLALVIAHAAVTLGRVGTDESRLVFPDLVAPLIDMDGGEVLRRLHEDPATADIRIAVLFADAAFDRREALLQAGAVRYLTKPRNIAELMAAVAELLAAPAELLAPPDSVDLAAASGS